MPCIHVSVMSPRCLLLRDDGVREFVGVAETHLDAGELLPRLAQDIVHFLPRHRAGVVAPHVVGEPRLVPPPLGRCHAAAAHPSVFGRVSKQNTRTVRALPPAECRNLIHHGLGLAAGVAAQMQELHAGVGEQRGHHPCVIRHVRLLYVTRQIEAELPREVRAVREHPHQFFGIRSLRLARERQRMPHQASLAHGVLDLGPAFGRVLSVQDRVGQPGR